MEQGPGLLRFLRDILVLLLPPTAAYVEMRKGESMPRLVPFFSGAEIFPRASNG